MGIGETITVINKSGKVVSSSKHFVNVFKEAKAAYKERKAEIQADRDASVREKRLSEGMRTIRIEDDNVSRASSRRSRHSTKSHRSQSHRPSLQGRPPLERGYTDSFYANKSMPLHSHRFEPDLSGYQHRYELARRSTDLHVTTNKRRDSYDMDLAYGDVPPPLPDRTYEDAAMKEKASKITMLLDEANCLQHTVTHTIENLQKNPEALAAVSLTLAEISALLTKMGPGMLVTLKSSFPAVAALLLSPQFMIAGGVAVGVTIVALGGYKIIKKIQAQNPETPALPMAHRAGPESNLGLDELEPQEYSRVEMWRRGIADVEASSAGTDVDGEFITPGASRALVAAGVLDENDLKSRRSTRTKKGQDASSELRSKTHRAKSVKSSSGKSETRRSKTVRDGASSAGGSKKESRKKGKEPSGLRMLLRSQPALA